MAINLLDMLKDQMTSSVVGQISKAIGENSSSTGSAISTMIPAILGGIIGKGGTESGAGRLLNMIADGKHDGSMFDNLGSVLGGGDATSGLMKTGGSLLSGILGNNLGSVLDMLTKATGMGRNSSSSLMNMLAPMVMGMVGRYVKKNDLNAGGLMKMLMGQKEHVASALPAGMGNLLGFGASTGGTSRATAAASSNNDSNGGGGWMKWVVLGLLALLGLGYFGMRTGCAAVDNAATTVSSTTGDLVDGAGSMIKSAAGYTKDATGNLVDKTGKVIAKAGEFTVDATGNIVDGTGKMIDKAASAVSGAFNYTKDAAGNLVNEAGEVVHKAGDFTMDASGNIVDASGKVLEAAATKVSDAANATGEAVNNVAGAAKGAMSSVTLMEDASGNLVDKTGNIIAKKGEWSKDKDGNFLNKAGKAISGVAKKVGGAVGDAANATGGAIAGGATAFKNKFTGMFKKAEEAKAAGGATTDDAKKKGGKIGGAIGKVTGKAKDAATGSVAGSIKYTLTDIVFKDNSARIETFTKAEVEGLADALKSYPKASIKVQTLGTDKALSTQRATAVHDMLVALGVDKKQLSHKGMKGDNTKVEIIVD